MKNDSHPRVLIVGTVPYNEKSTSRAFDAYFHNWEKENLAQIFSNTKKPCKGHCGTLYQITDQRILHCWIGRREDTGVIFKYEELTDAWTNTDLEVGSNVIVDAYKIGSRHTPFTHLMRGLLWRKKFWCTKKLNDWLDEFRPECVFLAFSDDYFIPNIALYVAERYNIPVVSCIGDDYYFNMKKTFNPLYHLYKKTYHRLIHKVFSHKGSAIYISDKIRDKYNSAFGLDGETVYLSSTVQRKEFCPINKKNPTISYFGNIRMGRNKSLDEIGRALRKINPTYMLEIYSNETDPTYYEIFADNLNTEFKGSIPYAEVQHKIGMSDVTIIVEGFEPENIDKVRYSLSTKAADALASGACILAYGAPDCGIIEYMQSTEAAMVCTSKADLTECIRTLVDDEQFQKKCYDNAVRITEKYHNLNSSCAIAEGVINKAINKREMGEGGNARA